MLLFFQMQIFDFCWLLISVDFFLSQALALKAIKQRNIIHRDIKPQNLLLSFPRDRVTPAMRHFRDSTIKLGQLAVTAHRVLLYIQHTHSHNSHLAKHATQEIPLSASQ